MDLQKSTIVVNRLDVSDSFKFTHVCPDIYRNVHKVRINTIVMPMLINELYITLVIEELGIRMPFMFDERFIRLTPCYEYPLKVTNEHVKSYENPIASVRKLTIKFLDSNNRVVTPSDFYNPTNTLLEGEDEPRSCLLFMTLYHDQTNRIASMNPLNQTLKKDMLFMYDWRMAVPSNGGTVYDTYDLNIDFTTDEPLRNVSRIKLLGLVVPPFTDTPYVILRLPNMGVEWPVHFEYWDVTLDVIPLRTLEAHTFDLDPTRHVQQFRLQLLIPDAQGSKKIAKQSDHVDTESEVFGVQALFYIEYMPRLRY